MKKKRGNKEKIKKTRKGRKENMKCYKVNDRKFPSKFLRNSFNSNFPYLSNINQLVGQTSSSKKTSFHET